MISLYPQKWLSFPYLFPPVYICHQPFVFGDDFIKASTHILPASVDCVTAHWGLNKITVIMHTAFSPMFFLNGNFNEYKIWYSLFKFHKTLLLRVQLQHEIQSLSAWHWLGLSFDACYQSSFFLLKTFSSGDFSTPIVPMHKRNQTGQRDQSGSSCLRLIPSAPFPWHIWCPRLTQLLYPFVRMFIRSVSQVWFPCI